MGRGDRLSLDGRFTMANMAIEAGRLEDLMLAAEVLKGRKELGTCAVSSSPVLMRCNTASSKIEAGATVSALTCGPFPGGE